MDGSTLLSYTNKDWLTIIVSDFPKNWQFAFSSRRVTCVRRTAASLSTWLSEGTQSKKGKKWLLRNKNKRKNQGKAVVQRTDYLLSRWAWITWTQFLVNEVFILMRLGACFQWLGSIQPHSAVNEVSNMWCSWVLYFCNTNLNKNINDTILFNDLPRGTGAIDIYHGPHVAMDTRGYGHLSKL